MNRPLSALVLLAAAAPLRAESLDDALRREADGLVAELRSRKCRTVAVLKFLVHDGAEKRVSDSVGPLNTSLARRLELALILSRANDVTDPARQVGVVRDASAHAAEMNGADYRTPEGRRKLFAAEYPLAWGGKSARPDAILTGAAAIDPKNRDLRVTIYACYGPEDEPKPLKRFTAPIDVNTLVEAGRSFRLRGLFDKGEADAPAEKVQERAREEAIKASAAVREGEEKHPAAAEAEAPVMLKVTYDGREVPLRFKDGRAEIEEPRQGQKVRLTLARRDAGKERLAVVLKVNGENTLYRQRLRDLECSKWVLEPGAAPLVIEGFQIQGKHEAEEFVVLSREESKAGEIYYGKDVGTITMTVFGPCRGKPTPKTVSDDELDRLILQRGEYPDGAAADLGRLREQLSKVRPSRDRGVIGRGKAVEFQTYKVEYDPDPTPLLAVTVRYYKPEK
jgi:hypothetical protein